MTKRDKAKVAMWSVLRIFLGERDEADFASDCTVIGEIGFSPKINVFKLNSHF